MTGKKKIVAVSSKLGSGNGSVHNDLSAVEQKDSDEFVLIGKNICIF